jgi:hypothetical protein
MGRRPHMVPYRNQAGSPSLFSAGRSRRATRSGRQGPPVLDSNAGGPTIEHYPARVSPTPSQQGGRPTPADRNFAGILRLQSEPTFFAYVI